MLARLTTLSKQLAIYGLGDVATSIASFLLLPVYVRYLSPADYGVIGLLLTIEAVAKIAFRWGIDASFMRLWYDCTDQRARQRLASTLFWFLAALNGALLLVALFAAPVIARHLFGDVRYTTLLRLVLANTFVVGFYFIPFHVMRIQGESARFISLTFTRSAGTLLLRLLFVIALDYGVLGVVLADLVITGLFTLLLSRWFVPLIRPVFSASLLREALHFGLPRLPHGVAHQVIAVADRYILTLFVSLREIGLYSVGASFGLAMKLFLSAFENAWAPFYFATMKEPDAQKTFGLVTTYGIAILVLLAAGLAAISVDLVRLMTTPAYYEAARVIPWIGLGVLCQGVYLLTSIGLNITKQTRYYPISTAVGAATSVGMNLLLVPEFGALGAAWANTVAYAVLAFTAMQFSQRFYPMDYEWGRIGRVAVAGLAAYGVARFALPRQMAPLPSFLLHGTTVVVVYPLLLLAFGFYHPAELAVVRRLATRLRRRTAAAPTDASTELAGEIVQAALPDEMIDAPEPDSPGADMAPVASPPDAPSRR